MEHWDRGVATQLQMEVDEQAFQDEYRSYRDDWKHKLGQPGALPYPIWLELSRRQRRRLAAADADKLVRNSTSKKTA